MKPVFYAKNQLLLKSVRCTFIICTSIWEWRYTFMSKIKKIDINYMSARNRLFRKNNNSANILPQDDGAHISDIHINKTSHLIFNIIDKISSSFQNHSKFEKAAINLCEKLIKFSEKL